MTYLVLSLGFLAAATLVAVIAGIVRRRAGHQAPSPFGWRALILGGAALMLLTAVFDNIMIGVGLFHYADSEISGLRLGLAPVEDFSYPLVALILLPALWLLFGGNRAEDITVQKGRDDR